MALKTINDLTALTTPASTDLVGVWAVGAARMRKSTIAQTFSPMLAVANVFSAKQTMDALLALKKNVAPGTTSGYLELGTDANGDLKVQNDAGVPRTLAGSITGGGTVATGGFTLTVPATGTAALTTGVQILYDKVLSGGSDSTQYLQYIDSLKTMSGMTEVANIIFRSAETGLVNIDVSADGTGVSRNSTVAFSVRASGTERYLRLNGTDQTMSWYGVSGTGTAALEATASGVIQRTTSDERLKTDVRSIHSADALEIIKQLRPVRFLWRKDLRSERGATDNIGLIAQDVAPFVPEVIGMNQSGMMTLDYAKLTALLIAAVQEVSSRLDLQ